MHGLYAKVHWTSFVPRALQLSWPRNHISLNHLWRQFTDHLRIQGNFLSIVSVDAAGMAWKFSIALARLWLKLEWVARNTWLKIPHYFMTPKCFHRKCQLSDMLQKEGYFQPLRPLRTDSFTLKMFLQLYTSRTPQVAKHMCTQREVFTSLAAPELCGPVHQPRLMLWPKFPRQPASVCGPLTDGRNRHSSYPYSSWDYSKFFGSFLNIGEFAKFESWLLFEMQ